MKDPKPPQQQEPLESRALSQVKEADTRRGPDDSTVSVPVPDPARNAAERAAAPAPDGRQKWPLGELKALAARFRAVADDPAAILALHEEVRVRVPFCTEVHDLIDRFRVAGGTATQPGGKEHVIAVADGVEQRKV